MPMNNDGVICLNFAEDGFEHGRNLISVKNVIRMKYGKVVFAAKSRYNNAGKQR